MTDVTLGFSAYQLSSIRPSQTYGQPAVLPLRSGDYASDMRAALSKIPSAATVVSAVAQFTQLDAVSGSFPVLLRPATSTWSSNVTWSTRPTLGASVTVTKTSPAAGTVWAFDVTAMAQAIVSGTAVDRGFDLSTSASTLIKFAGSTAATGKPVLVVTYTLAPPAPSNLHPAGVTALSKPTLQFDAVSDMVSEQVQIDPAASTTSPAFDSGEVASTAGLLDLTATSYAGLTSGSTQWRSRQKNGQGWGPWSSWVTMTRVAKSTLTITSPGASTPDGTPPITWTFGGVQKAWQVRLIDATTLKVLADSKKQSGTATAWTPPAGLTVDGQTGTVEVRVWDDQDRVSSPGDTEYTKATLGITLSLDNTVGAVDSVTATQDGTSPVVVLTGTRAAGTPDEVAVFRNGALVQRMPGTSAFTGTAFTIRDVPPMNVPVTYRVAPITNAHISKTGPTVTLTPKCQGIWLVSLTDPTKAAPIWGTDDQDQSQPEVAVVHTPISDGDGTVQVVRRRLVRMPEQGTVTGELLDVGTYTAAAAETFLRGIAAADAGSLYLLVMGNMVRTVIVGDLDFNEVAVNTAATRVLDVAFNWWCQS